MPKGVQLGLADAEAIEREGNACRGRHRIGQERQRPRNPPGARLNRRPMFGVDIKPLQHAMDDSVPNPDEDRRNGKRKNHRGGRAIVSTRHQSFCTFR